MSLIQHLPKITALLLWTAFAQAAKLPVERIRVPPGFHVEVYAADIKGARSMAQGPDGILFVGTRNIGNVYALKPQKAGQPPKVFTLAKNLNQPNGVVFHNGALFVMEIHRLIRFDHIAAHLENPPSPVVVKDNFPTDQHHGWKFIRLGPDGKLYIPVGAPCNNCKSADPYAALGRMSLDGSGWEIVARGIRNTVGFDWHPVTKELWFTDNGRDWLGNERPGDELNRLEKAGQHFGYPYCHEGDLADPEFGSKHACSEFVPPVQKLGPHVAALGMRFYTGKQFPEKYRQQIFIAEHGSWNRDKPIGYRVMWVRLQDNKAVRYETFAEGWLAPEGAWGRPVDVEVLPDGSLLVSDDFADAIYRITYRAK